MASPQRRYQEAKQPGRRASSVSPHGWMARGRPRTPRSSSTSPACGRWRPAPRWRPRRSASRATGTPRFPASGCGCSRAWALPRPWSQRTLTSAARPVLLAPSLHVVPPGLAARLEEYVRPRRDPHPGAEERRKGRQLHGDRCSFSPALCDSVAGATVEDYDMFGARPGSPRRLALRDGSGAPARRLGVGRAPRAGGRGGGAPQRGRKGRTAASRRGAPPSGKGQVHPGRHRASTTRPLRGSCASTPGSGTVRPSLASLEVVSRERADGSGRVTFYLNHSDQPASVRVPGPAVELLSGATVADTVRLEPFAVAILSSAD